MESATPPATPRPDAVSPNPAQEVRDLQVILGIARAMAAAIELDELLELILNGVRQTLNAERATLFLYDPVTDELHSKIAHGTDEIRFPAGAGIAGAAAQGRKLVNIPDAYEDPRFNRDVDRKTGYVTRCLLTLPLVGVDGQLVGVVQVLNKIDGVFTAYDERLAEALAAQVGVALQHAPAHAALRREEADGEFAGHRPRNPAEPSPEALTEGSRLRRRRLQPARRADGR